MKALVLNGGGTKGAYQAGALKHLLGERGECYDIISGTSVGALNGAYLAMFSHGNELDAAQGLERLWYDLESSKVWQKWYGGLLGTIPVALPKWLGGKDSAYSTEPLRRFVKDNLKPRAITASGRILRIGAVNLRSGARRVWTEKDTDELRDAVLASSAFPMLFEPVEINGSLYTDAGVREVSPIEDAIKAGAREIHMIACDPDEMFVSHEGHGSGLQLGRRVLEVMSSEIEKWDVKVVELYNALYESRHMKAVGKTHITLKVLRPMVELTKDPLDFDRAKIRENVLRGLVDARTMDWDPPSAVVSKNLVS